MVSHPSPPKANNMIIYGKPYNIKEKKQQHRADLDGSGKGWGRYGMKDNRKMNKAIDCTVTVWFKVLHTGDKYKPGT